MLLESQNERVRTSYPRPFPSVRDLGISFTNQTRPSRTPLVRYVSRIYQDLHEGSRLVVNQPPRTLKSWIAKSYAAWRMGLDPTEKLLFLSATSDLAEDNVYDVRQMMQSGWFQRTFPHTRIAKDRSGLVQLRTTEGGSFFAGSMNASLGGIGATITLIDDGNRIQDCDRPERLDATNEKFDTEILSRLNPESGRKRKGIVLNVQHRIAQNDLSNHLVSRHGFKCVTFPLIATRRRDYLLDTGKTWTREVGDLLLDSYSDREIENARRSKKPPFFYFYQQAVGTDKRTPISETAFNLASRRNIEDTHIISVDTAQRDNGSFNVVQVWNVSCKPLHLQEQFRERCGFPALEMAAVKLIAHFRPAAVLIENAANGSALLARLRERFPGANFVPIEPLDSGRTSRSSSGRDRKGFDFS